MELGREKSMVHFVADSLAGLLDIGKKPGKASIENLGHVDVAELAVKPAKLSLRLGTIALVLAAADLVQCVSTARYAEA
jgi:hypothetical protein